MGDHTESRKSGTDSFPCYECERPHAMFLQGELSSRIAVALQLVQEKRVAKRYVSM